MLPTFKEHCLSALAAVTDDCPVVQADLFPPTRLSAADQMQNTSVARLPRPPINRLQRRITPRDETKGARVLDRRWPELIYERTDTRTTIAAAVKSVCRNAKRSNQSRAVAYTSAVAYHQRRLQG